MGPLARSGAKKSLDEAAGSKVTPSMSLERENDIPQTDDNYHSKLFLTPSL